jgi:hypothetical protein
LRALIEAVQALHFRSQVPAHRPPHEHLEDLVGSEEFVIF